MDRMLASKWFFYIAVMLAVAYLFMNSTASGNALKALIADWWR